MFGEFNWCNMHHWCMRHSCFTMWITIVPKVITHSLLGQCTPAVSRFSSTFLSLRNISVQCNIKYSIPLSNTQLI
ncbi:hypothetical protein EB796_019285 [Bugula neritina]|uniref:Uncharacterized protein n=1 Tax=Bugula neritina TaxID=10212 RepID=A0A7J7J8Q1_BUGNE|nr:hypothetical protein EB796_019285 [Bugula neritina]